MPMQSILQNSNKRLEFWESRQKNKSGRSQCPNRRKKLQQPAAELCAGNQRKQKHRMQMNINDKNAESAKISDIRLAVYK